MAGEVRGEEQNRVGDLLWTGDFPQRNAEFKLLAKAANTLFFGVIACLLYTSDAADEL
mgnify:CR=1 FL=1